MEDRNKLPVEGWIESARAGSAESLGRALEAYRAYLARTASEELGSDLRPKEGVSDIVQETFLEAHRDFPRFSGRTGSEWKAWLRRILLHNLGHVVRRYRDSAKRAIGREVSLNVVESRGVPDAGLMIDSGSPSQCAMQKERTQSFRGAMERLPERDRQFLTWRLEEQCTFEEIGRRRDYSGAAARKEFRRIIERLLEELGSSSTERSDDSSFL